MEEVQESYRQVSYEEFNRVLTDRDPYFENTQSYGTTAHTRYVDNDFVPIGYSLSRGQHDEFFLVNVD